MGIPKHIVLFPDGNRRWARAKGLDIREGYKEGAKNFRRFLEHCMKRGVFVVTVFGFSTENWTRPQEEVEFLLKFFSEYMGSSELQKFKEQDVQLRVIGQRERLPDALKAAINRAEEFTKDCKKGILNLAVSYGGKWDIVQAVQKIIEEGITADKVTEQVIESHLSNSDLPLPDLVIRAGGEQRLSNFVLWQAAYSELYFSPKLWPDFSESDLDAALEEFAARQRRFGK